MRIGAKLVSITFILAAFMLGWAQRLLADPYPPNWGSGAGPAVHFAPVAWPNEPAKPQDCGATCGDWQPYTRYARSINDQRTQDPSNGGTAPQNYVNIASSCIDTQLPSVYYYLDQTNNVLMFRWRVEQIANTYATGPAPGTYGSTHPWNSALWTVFFDMDGNGYRDLAAHLNGSSGSPATPIDQIVGIWGNIPNNQSLDYPTNPNVHLLGHNPTAFIDESTNRILNFQNRLQPTANWPNGAAETVWDYGTSRARLIETSACKEYFVDYQIPLAMVDASKFSGPKVTADSPFSMLFCTANSLNNPFQKDCVFEGDWIGDPTKPAPFGDYFSLTLGSIQQPIVDEITATGCGPTILTARIKDTIDIVNKVATTSVTAVDFYYYFDANNDGLANDGGAWTFAASATNRSLNQWSASWNATALLQGQYLIGLQALDNAGKNASGKGNRTFSYLTQAEVDALKLSPGQPTGEEWYPNPAVVGAVATTVKVNSCGAPPPYVAKTANASEVAAGDPVQFTIHVYNTLDTPLQVSAISDALPAGFSYLTSSGGTLNPTSSPGTNATGAITWLFSPAVSLAAKSTGTLVFTAKAATVVGAYSNVASASTSNGPLTSEPLQISVGAPRLTLAKSANSTSFAPGQTITYTLTYGNDSSINVTGAVITDTVPVGLSNITPLDGGGYDSTTRKLTWNVGAVPSGVGGLTVRFRATVDNPYPDAAAIPLVNSAEIGSPQTVPSGAESSVYVSAPRPQFTLSKRANLLKVTPGAQVIFTLAYQNTGNGSATGVVIADTLPTGFSFVTASNGGTHAGGAVTWNIGTVAAGASGSVTLTLQADSPYTGSSPASNSATIDSAQTDPVSDTYKIGVVQAGGSCTTYYFHETMEIVGVGEPQYLANTTAPTSATATLDTLSNVGSTEQEIARFYQNPAAGAAFDLSGTITNTIYAYKSGAPQAYFRVQVYDYDPDGDSATLLGEEKSANISGNKSNELTTIAITLTGNKSIAAGHRLLWIVKAATDHASQTNTLGLNFDGTSSQSRSRYCISSAPSLVLEKSASSGTIVPGGALTYTIDFANTGDGTATGASITDTLPVGVTFVGATLNGAAATPTINGQELIFAINSSDTGTSGQVTGGQSGQLVIIVTVDKSLAPTVSSLSNTAAVGSDQTEPASDTVSLLVQRPKVTVSKAASNTLLIPGAMVTFTLTVLNSGDATATGVTVQDALPVQSYFQYVAGSTRRDGVAVSPEPVTGGVLNLNIGALALGAATKVTFQMQVAASGAPAGITTLDNTAAVSDEQTAGSRASNTVTVAISTNPNLRLVKSATPTVHVAPGDLITYTVIVSNIGSGDALDVLLQDLVPDNSTYKPNSLVYENTAQSDVADGDPGRFDAARNRVLVNLGTLPGGASRTMRFTVRVGTPLPAGLTTLESVATVSASNATSRQAAVTHLATAAPLLTLKKSGPAAVAYPAATLAAMASNTTQLTVDESIQLVVGQYLRIGGQIVRIVALQGNLVTVDAPVTAAVGAELIGSILYVIDYRNEGNASATSVLLTDNLPEGTTLIAASADGEASGNLVTWDLGALQAGDSGQVQVTLFPVGSGEIQNQATILSKETPPVTAVQSTLVGGLRLRKYTTTPTIQQTLDGASASYVIELTNSLGKAVDGVIITDTLPAGMTYLSTSSISGGTRTTGMPEPQAGADQPVWGAFSIPAFGSLSLTFAVKVDASVGPASYQNDVTASAANGVRVAAFDSLSTLAEDVAVQVPIIVLTKAVTPESVMAGEVVRYTITAYNVGSAPALGVQLTDLLPSGFTYSADVALTAEQATRTSVLTPSAGSATPTWGSWDIAPFGQVTIIFEATTGLTAGQFVNTVHATAANTLIPPLVGVAAVTTTERQVGEISGVVFNDSNKNGVLDAGEKGVTGITVELRRETGETLRTQVTNATGDYRFDNLTPGVYVVESLVPGEVTMTTARRFTLTMVAGAALRADFGVTTEGQVGEISGVVFNDSNRNGVLDAGEKGVTGITVELSRETGEVLSSQVTDAAGAYRFEHLFPGVYAVYSLFPAEATMTTARRFTLTVSPGAALRVDFGVRLNPTALPDEQEPGSVQRIFLPILMNE
jgi:uncharacterized repeat protein (TIGR01451 family)